VVDFINEVDEELRADRYQSLFRRYLPWAATMVGALVVGWLGVWGYEQWRNNEIGKASDAYDAAVKAIASGDRVGGEAKLKDVADHAPGGYRALALIQLGSISAAENKAGEAVAYFDRSAQASTTPVIADFARLRAAQTLLDTAPLAQVKSRLDAIIGDKKPYDAEAREALGLAYLLAGQPTPARNEFNGLKTSLSAPQGVKERAAEAIAMIDAGDAGAFADAVRKAPQASPADMAALGALQGAPPPAAAEQGASEQ
jgi:hypothetical protein